MWNSLHPIILPAVLLNLVPEAYKNTYLGLLTFVGLIIATVVQPLSGSLSDGWGSRWGRRRPLILFGTLFDFAFLALLARPDRMAWLAIGYLGLQVSSNIAHGPLQGLLPDRVPPEQLGAASGIKNLLDMGGLIAAALLAGRLLDPQARNPAAMMAALAAFLAVSAGITLLGVREEPSVGSRAAAERAGFRDLLRVDLRAHGAYWRLIGGLYPLPRAIATQFDFPARVHILGRVSVGIAPAALAGGGAGTPPGMRCMKRWPGTLIATLGSKPQVVTTAADLLLADGYGLKRVTVLHPGGDREPMASALACLRDEFASYPAYQPLELDLQPIPGPDGPLPDVETQADAEAAFRAVYRSVLDAKRREQAVHLSIVGGRRVFAVYGMAAAQLLFDDEDCLWYVLAGGKFLAEERLHPRPGDEARLIRVPVLRWGTISPMLTDLSRIEDPFEAVERQGEARVRETLEAAQAFVWGSLSGAERRVVELLVREGLTDGQIAERLVLSRNTVGTHLEHIYRKARDRWRLESVNRTQLVGLLSLFYALRDNREGGVRSGE